ncbi:MAG: single-stranded DNA-binding protein [Planctomycetia bacterium]|nr:MAG: single-stranded DNA-binding protein [Planctomycetia bacterium]RIK71763.1 MAG: single-stranded DNA-binding protein [Planctomycetota bacterium]
MANFNKVILAGNLTRDPQLTYLPSNTAVCEFGMAINRKWKSQNGDMRDETCFVDLRAYGRPAETLNQYMSKGKPLLVEGRLKYDQWEGKDGQKRSKLYVVVDNFQFLGSGGAGVARGNQEGGGGRVQRPQPAAAPTVAGADEPPPYDDVQPPAGDDIPF